MSDVMLPEESCAVNQEMPDSKTNGEKAATNGRSRIFHLLSIPPKFVGEVIWDIGKGLNRAWEVSDGRDGVTKVRDFVRRKLNGRN